MLGSGFWVLGLGVLGFRGLVFRGLGFQGFGFKVWGFKKGWVLSLFDSWDLVGFGCFRFSVGIEG